MTTPRRRTPGSSLLLRSEGMRQFFQNHKKMHIWLLSELALLAAVWCLRGHRALMNALEGRLTGPFRLAVGRLCYAVPFSVMELLCVLLVLGIGIYLLWSALSVYRARGRRGSRLWSALLGLLNGGLAIYLGFCLLWGVNYYIDSFQERSGIYARPMELAELRALTADFAHWAARAGDQVPRNEEGL